MCWCSASWDATCSICWKTAGQLRDNADWDPEVVLHPFKDFGEDPPDAATRNEREGGMLAQGMVVGSIVVAVVAVVVFVVFVVFVVVVVVGHRGIYCGGSIVLTNSRYSNYGICLMVS